MVMIRPLAVSDKAQWRRLFEGYGEFYAMPLSDKTVETVWAWLNDPSHVLEGLVAQQDNDLAGMAHYRAMPSPLRGAEVGFLDDLYVDPTSRGTGAAKALLLHLQQIGRERGWQKIRWITADDNYTARRLYDRVAVKMGWNLYEMSLGC